MGLVLLVFVWRWDWLDDFEMGLMGESRSLLWLSWGLLCSLVPVLVFPSNNGIWLVVADDKRNDIKASAIYFNFQARLHQMIEIFSSPHIMFYLRAKGYIYQQLHRRIASLLQIYQFNYHHLSEGWNVWDPDAGGENTRKKADSEFNSSITLILLSLLPSAVGVAWSQKLGGGWAQEIF